VALGSCGSALYEPHNFVVERLTLRLPRWPRALDGFRLAQLSDVHFDDYLHAPYFDLVVNAINRENADLAVLTGDYVTVSSVLFGSNRHVRERLWRCAEMLAGIRAVHGCYAILGNHDVAGGADEVIAALGAHNIPVLRNRSLPLAIGSERFWLAGVDDEEEGRPDLKSALNGIPRGECVLMGMHEPDFADTTRRLAGEVVDLQLSGHSHGGQVRLPGMGALILPEGARKYPMGHYRLGPLQLYTNRGIGVIDVPLRLFCPPEITLLTLYRA
jgi:hypothetical protein